MSDFARNYVRGGFADEVASSRATIQSNYFSPGRFIVEIKDWKIGENRKGNPYAALETEIVRSDNHDAHPPGSLATWMVILKGGAGSDMAASNIKAAICGITGASEKEVDSEVVQYCLGAESDDGGMSPLAGNLILVTAVNVKTRAGNDFTRCTFKKVGDPDNLPDIQHRDRSTNGASADDGDYEDPPF